MADDLPTFEQLPDGSTRITLHGISGTVSSWHLVPPKIRQLQRLSGADDTGTPGSAAAAPAE